MARERTNQKIIVDSRGEKEYEERSMELRYMANCARNEAVKRRSKQHTGRNGRDNNLSTYGGKSERKSECHQGEQS